VPGAGQINGPGYSVVVPVQVYWTGESWSRVVWREFPNREAAERHLAANTDQMVKRAAKQFGAEAKHHQEQEVQRAIEESQS